MNTTIDIEALENMKVTDDFSKLLFGRKCRTLITVKTKHSFIEWHYRRWTPLHQVVQITNTGSIWKAIWYNKDKELLSEPIDNAFQIVRHIDNYLNSLK